MPITRSSTKADRLVSPLIPQKRKPGTSTTEGTNPEAPPDTEAEAPPDTEAEAPPDTEAEAPPDTEAEAPPDTEAEAPPDTEASADAGVLPPDDTPGDDGDTWSDVDQEDTPLSSMNDLIDQVLFLGNERQSPWTERGAPDKPRHWANQYVRTQQTWFSYTTFAHGFQQ